MCWEQVTRIGSQSIRWGTPPVRDTVTNLVTIMGTDRDAAADRIRRGDLML